MTDISRRLAGNQNKIAGQTLYVLQQYQCVSWPFRAETCEQARH